MSKYSKAIAAVLAGLAVAIPMVISALADGSVSLVEWLAILGAVLGAPTVVALSPANKLSTGDLVDQINRNPQVNLVPIEAKKASGTSGIGGYRLTDN